MKNEFPRKLSEDELKLTKWLLENGLDKNESYESQLSEIEVSSQCSCGCASVDFSMNGNIPDYKNGMTIISDYYWKSKSGAQNGCFLFAIESKLAGIEVYSIDGIETPMMLPNIKELKRFEPDNHITSR